MRVLMVCWGNICRSPTAEGVLRRMVDERGLAGTVLVDSAGTSAEHQGEPPDERARAEAGRRGIDLAGLRARQVTPDDYERFDLLLAADEVVERRLLDAAPDGARGRIRRLTEFGPDTGRWSDIPDPYFGGDDGFVQVYELVERACAGLLDHLVAEGRI